MRKGNYTTMSVEDAVGSESIFLSSMSLWSQILSHGPLSCANHLKQKIVYDCLI